MSQKRNKRQQQKAKKGQKDNKIVVNPFHFSLAAIIFVIAFLLYSNTIQHEYALDDNSVITDSHIVREGASNIGKIFSTRYREGSFGKSSTMYRPMSIAMFAIEWGISPDNPQLSHFINVLLFALTCFLLFLTFKEILGKYSIWLPFLTVLLFAVHPIHTEIVANIKSRDEILVLLFGTLALHQIWKYSQNTSAIRHLLLSCLALTAALFSKENAVNFVAIIPLTLFFFSQLPLKKIGIITLSYIGPTLFFLIIRGKILGNSVINKDKTIKQIDNFLAAPDITWLEQKATAIWVLGKYLLLLIFPQPLICDYNYNYIEITNIYNPYVFVAFIIHIGLLIYAFLNFRQKKLLSYAILFYLINMFLYSNLFLVIGAGLGERFLYIGSFGFCLGIAFLMTKFLGKTNHNSGMAKDLKTMFSNQIPLLSVTAILFMLFAFQTINRNSEWYNSFTLYQADIKKAPESARLNGYLGTEYLKEGKLKKDVQQQKHYFNQALEVYTKAVEIYPDYTEAIGQLGLTYFRLGNYGEASKWYEKAIKDPKCKGSIYSNYGMLFFSEALVKQQVGDQQNFKFMINKAKEMYEQSLKREPNFSDGYMNLGSTYGVMGDHQKAIQNFEEALKYAKDEQKFTIYSNLAQGYKNIGKNAAAQDAQNKANGFK